MQTKGYQAYKNMSSTGLTLGQNVAFLLERAANHVAVMAECMENGQIEQRAIECNHTSMILDGLKNTVVRINPEQSVTADHLERYYSTFYKLILRASIKCDVKAAVAIKENLRDMATFWYQLDANLQSNPTVDQGDAHLNRAVRLGV